MISQCRLCRVYTSTEWLRPRRGTGLVCRNERGCGARILLNRSLDRLLREARRRPPLLEARG